MKLTTDAELAEQFGITLEQLTYLRLEHHWPHVKFGRKEVRFSEEQIAQIVELESTRSTRKPTGTRGSKAAVSVKGPGQTKRSRSRRRQPSG